MPSKPTKDTTAVNIELPTDLVNRVRDFARRDLRPIKSEFIRALELLLATYDPPGAAPTAMAGATAARRPASCVLQMDDEAFNLFRRAWVKKRRPPYADVYRYLREGLDAGQMEAKGLGPRAEVQLHIDVIESAVKDFLGRTAKG